MPIVNTAPTMKKIAVILAALALCGAALEASANVVRPAPDFLFKVADGRSSSLKSLRGQPVVMLVAPSHRSGAFRKQTKYLEEIYRKFAERDVVFVAVFTEGVERAQSDIPFVYPVDPVGLAAELGIGGEFATIVIGEDGNMDLVTSKVSAAGYIEAVINNAYPVQQRQRQ